MRGERALLRVGEFLVGRASLHLPRKIRDERHREWVAELPAILHDPDVRFAPRRAARMLRYATDNLRGAALASSRSGHRAARARALGDGLLSVACLGLLAWTIWDLSQAPGQWASYLQLAFGLPLAAWNVSRFMHASERTTWLLGISVNLGGMVAYAGNASQAPGDWANYFLATVFFIVVVVSCLVRWRVQKRLASRR